MNATDYYEEMVQNLRGLIGANLPRALELASIPKEDHQTIIDRVLGRLPTSICDSKARGLDPALVVGLGLLEAPRKENGLLVSPVSDDVRHSFTKVAFSDYTWDGEDYLDVEFEELTEALDLIMVTRDIGGDSFIDIVELSNQIDIFRQVSKSPLVTKMRALAAYKAMQNPKNPLRRSVCIG